MSEPEMIHRISKTRGIVDRSGQIINTIGYTTNSTIPRDERGHLTFTGAKQIGPDDDNCYAKELHLQRENGTVYYKYYVKTGLDGRLFDPWGMYSEGTQKDYAKRLGKPKWSFADCSPKCFEFYIKFLQSRNPAWLKNAERELR